jgi:hypothetical protein
LEVARQWVGVCERRNGLLCRCGFSADGGSLTAFDFAPTWSIDDDCRDTTFSIADVIELNTTGLHGKPFDWRHYGGPLALFRLCRFVRNEILKVPPSPRKVCP